MENERKVVKTPSLTKEAKSFNAIAIDNTVQGMRTAAYMDRQVIEAEREQREVRENPVREEMLIPTGADIREAREEGAFREIIQESEQDLEEER